MDWGWWWCYPCQCIQGKAELFLLLDLRKWFMICRLGVFAQCLRLLFYCLAGAKISLEYLDYILKPHIIMTGDWGWSQCIGCGICCVWSQELLWRYPEYWLFNITTHNSVYKWEVFCTHYISGTHATLLFVFHFLTAIQGIKASKRPQEATVAA